MKAKMIMLVMALLLVGNAQVFAAMKDIPSMRPAEIVKLDYARLSPAEQDSLWFTALFAGLEGTRKAAKQVISNAFPAAKWQKLEQIAQSAKQSNTIDNGIALARATVETRTPVAPMPVKAPTTVGAPSMTKPPMQPEPSVIKPTVSPAVQPTAPSATIGAQAPVQQGQQGQQQEPAAQVVTPTKAERNILNTIIGEIEHYAKELEYIVPGSTSTNLASIKKQINEKSFNDALDFAKNKRDEYRAVFERAQESEIQKVLERIEALDHSIKKLLPTAQRQDYQALKEMAKNATTVEAGLRILRQQETALQDTLNGVKKVRSKLDEKLASSKSIFSHIQSLNPGYKLSAPGVPLATSYDAYKKAIEDITEAQGISNALSVAIGVEQQLLIDKAAIEEQKKEAEKPQQDIVTPEMREVFAEAQIANATLDKLRAIDPIYAKDVDYSVIAREKLDNKEPANNIINYLKQENARHIVQEKNISMVRKEYDSNIGKIARISKAIQEKGLALPKETIDFADILNKEGLKKALAKQEEYIKVLNDIRNA